MTGYGGDYAAVYDELYRDKDYETEAGFVDERLVVHRGGRGSVVDVACGTGRHALALAAKGWDVLGVDLSEGMLAHAGERASVSGTNIDFARQDMRSLDLGRSFDAAVCLFDSIGYARDPDGVRSTIEGIHRHLTSDGLLMLEFWNAPAMLRGFEPVRVKRLDLPGARVVRISETSVDEGDQVAKVNYELLLLRSDGTFESFEELQVCRFFTRAEMERHLADGGFTPLEWYGGYGGPVSDDAFHLVVVARRA